MPIGLKGNTDGSGAVQIGGSDAISISTGLNTTFAGTITATGTVAGTTGTLYPIVSGTAVASTSGTAIDFTGIPSWVKRITVMFSGVSTNGSALVIVQLGTSSGVETTGYSGVVSTTQNAAATICLGLSVSFALAAANAASSSYDGVATINLVGSNRWAFQSVVGAANNQVGNCGGSKTTAATLDRVRITTANGTDTFDAGTINILFE